MTDDEARESPVETFIVEQHRAFGASTVRFGPFATLDEARAWCNAKGFGMIVLVNPPDVDTTAGAEVWR